MDKIWGTGDHIRIMHPGSECIYGRDDVSPRCFFRLKQVIGLPAKIHAEGVVAREEATKGKSVFQICVDY